MGVSDTIGFWPGDVTKRSWHTFLSEPASGFTLYSGGSSRKLLATEHTDMSHENSFHLCFECHPCLVWLMPFVKGLILVTSSALGLIQGALNAVAQFCLPACCRPVSAHRSLNFPLGDFSTSLKKARFSSGRLHFVWCLVVPTNVTRVPARKCNCAKPCPFDKWLLNT